ncbi:MAG TPA: lipase family protein [Polyangiaceae bacterium]|nr:lipase family protein [Polyangiaceae bacterium]
MSTVQRIQNRIQGRTRWLCCWAALWLALAGSACAQKRAPVEATTTSEPSEAPAATSPLAVASARPVDSVTTTDGATSPSSTASARAPAFPSLLNIAVRPPDAFYDPPAELPPTPGALLRSEPLEGVALPAGMRGWRILYTTSIDDRTPATAVATVFASTELPAGPRPVITWAHGTTGLVQACMPSLVSVPSEGIPARDRIVQLGWVVVATDYAFAEKGGPHPYAIGEGEARSALDAVRAARRMPELTLEPKTVVWGHSQGGHAALWTGSVGPRYAPDIQILGVAAIAPTADLQRILSMNVEVDKRLGAYVARAYSRFYPDVTFEQALRPEALAAAREMQNLCGFLPLDHPRRIHALATSFEGPALATSTNPALAARLAQNAANSAIAAPVVVAQGLADIVVPAPATDAYVKARCAAGQRLEYWTFEGPDHISIVRPGTPLDEPLVAWTKARFGGEPQAAGCARKSF